MLPDGREGVVIAVVEHEATTYTTHSGQRQRAPPWKGCCAILPRGIGMRTRSERPALSRLLTVGIVAAITAATLTVLLLSAIEAVAAADPIARQRTRFPQLVERQLGAGDLRTGGGFPRGATQHREQAGTLAG